MWDPVKGTVHVTCNVVWLKKMYYKEQQGGETLVLEPRRIKAKVVSWDADVLGIGKEAPVGAEPDQEATQGKTEEEKSQVEVKTRYRRTIKKPTLYGYDYGLTTRLTPAEEKFYHEMK